MEDCSTDERLQQETLCRRQWTDEYVERAETLMRQNVVVVLGACVRALTLAIFIGLTKLDTDVWILKRKNS